MYSQKLKPKQDKFSKDKKCEANITKELNVIVMDYSMYTEQRKFFVDNLITSVKLADVSNLRAKVKRGAKSMAVYRRGSCACTSVWLSAELEVPVRLVIAWPAPPPSFFMVMIQQPGNS